MLMGCGNGGMPENRIWEYKLHDALSRPLNWLYETHSVVFLSSWLAKIKWTKYLNPARCILAAWDIDQTDNIWQPYNSDAFHRTATTEKNSEGRQAQCTKFLRSQERTWQPEEPLSGIIWLTFLCIPLRNPICAYQCFYPRPYLSDTLTQAS